MTRSRPSAGRIPLLVFAVVLALGGCEGPTGPRGPAGDGPAGLSDPSILPKVVYTYPPAGKDGPYSDLYVEECGGYEWYYCTDYPVLKVRFNKLMEGASVRGALRLTSASGDASIAPGGVHPLGGDIFIVQPADSDGYRMQGFLPIGDRYFLTIDTTARDVNGNRLQAPFTLAFTPEPSFRVVESLPKAGTLLDDRSATLILTFNGRVDSSVFDAVKILPAPQSASGWMFEWDRRGIQRYLTLDGSTIYTVTVDTTAGDLAGHRLPEPFTWSFVSAPFRVVSVWPQDGAEGVPPFQYLNIAFTEAADTSTLRGALRISPPIAYELIWFDDEIVRIAHDEPFQPYTRYTLTIDTTLRSAAGARLFPAFSSGFTTGPLPRFQVVATSPLDGDTGAWPHQSIGLTLSHPVDTSSVYAAITTDPPVDGSISYGWDNLSLHFQPRDQWPMGGHIRVTIGAGLRSAGGALLGEPYSFSFTVQPLRVYSFQPLDGATEVGLSVPVRVSFNGYLSPASLAGAVSTEPAGDLVFSLDYSWLRIEAPSGWVPSTNYILRVDTTLTASGGGRLAQPFVTTFRTAPFRVIQFSPGNGVDDHQVGFPLYVYCNGPIDTLSVPAAFSLTDTAGNGVAGRFGYSGYYRDQFVFLPDTPLAPGTIYRMTVGTALKTLTGYPLESSRSIHFRTAP